MNFKAYINYIQDGRIHAGVYMDDFVIYVREAEPGTSNPLKGYLDLRLDEDAPRTWETIHSVLRDAYARIGTLRHNSSHHIDSASGSMELLYRDGLPATAEQALAELQKYFRRITYEGKIYELPQSA